MAGGAMAQAQKLAQVRRFDLSEQRHCRAILAARQQGAECDHQQLMQVVAGIVPSWVHNLGKAGDELFHRVASALDCTLIPAAESSDFPRLVSARAGSVWRLRAKPKTHTGCAATDHGSGLRAAGI